MPGEAGLSSKELDELKAHPIDALGEPTPDAHPNPNPSPNPKLDLTLTLALTRI